MEKILGEPVVTLNLGDQTKSCGGIDRSKAQIRYNVEEVLADLGLCTKDCQCFDESPEIRIRKSIQIEHNLPPEEEYRTARNVDDIALNIEGAFRLQWLDWPPFPSRGNGEAIYLHSSGTYCISHAGFWGKARFAGFGNANGICPQWYSQADPPPWELPPSDRPTWNRASHGFGMSVPGIRDWCC